VELRLGDILPARRGVACLRACRDRQQKRAQKERKPADSPYRHELVETP
jgi:hypothetical protein